MNDTPTQTIADALLLLSLGERNEIGKDASERLMKLERENAALREVFKSKIMDLQQLSEEAVILRVKNAALLADRDRLDWLEGEDGQSWTAKWYYWGEEWINRAAIDAAMKEAKP
jgi:hypothetical protein